MLKLILNFFLFINVIKDSYGINNNNSLINDNRLINDNQMNEINLDKMKEEINRQGDWIFDMEDFFCQTDDGECTG